MIKQTQENNKSQANWDYNRNQNLIFKIQWFTYYTIKYKNDMIISLIRKILH